MGDTQSCRGRGDTCTGVGSGAVRQRRRPLAADGAVTPRPPPAAYPPVVVGGRGEVAGAVRQPALKIDACSPAADCRGCRSAAQPERQTADWQRRPLAASHSTAASTTRQDVPPAALTCAAASLHPKVKLHWVLGGDAVGAGRDGCKRCKGDHVKQRELGGMDRGKRAGGDALHAWAGGRAGGRPTCHQDGALRVVVAGAGLGERAAAAGQV